MKKNNKSLIFVLTAILVLIIAVEVSATDTSNCPSGMVSYWKFDGSLTDELGIYDGTMGPYGSYADGNINQGLHGARGCSNPYAAKVDNFPNLDSFTIEAWINPACPPNSWQGSLTISKHDDMGSYNGVGYVLFTTPDPYGGSNYKFNLQTFDMDKGQNIASPLTYSCGNWAHVAVLRDRGNVFKLFVNGEEVASALDNVVGSLANMEPLVFHGFTSGGCGWGMSAITMDEVAIYDRVLSNDEIQQHYQNGLNGGVYCIDSDGDGTPDSEDGCPEDSSKTEPGVCGCGVDDTDSDGDGTEDCNDLCPEDMGKTDPGICGCGIYDSDSDGDGVADCIDGCPDDSSKTEEGICGCGVADADLDNDGTEDCMDNCPDNSNKIDPGTCGCGMDDADSDNDGTADCMDNCQYDTNEDQEDSDGDSVGDVCDNCINTPNPDQEENDYEVYNPYTDYEYLYGTACVMDRSYIIVNYAWGEEEDEEKEYYEAIDIDGTIYNYGWNAFSSIEDALDAVEDAEDFEVDEEEDEGSTVYVFEGTYEECIDIEIVALNLVGQNRETTIIDGSDCWEDPIIKVEADNVLIDGFTFYNEEWNEEPVIKVEGKSVTISDVIIESEENYYGILIENGAGSSITNSVISNTYYGVYIEKGADSSITNSVISNTCSGLYLEDSSNILIEGNTIDSNGVREGCAEMRTGIDVYSSEGITIIDNEITNNDVGVHVDPNADDYEYDEDECSSGVVIINNKITGNDGNELTETEGYGIVAEGCEEEPEIEEDEGDEDSEEELDYSVDARLNWWGSADGPGGDGTGLGDRVSGDRIDYSPWYTSVDMTELKLTLPDGMTMNDDSSGITVNIPEGIAITASDEDWDGTINAPSIKELATVLPDIDSGYTGEVDQVIEIGFLGIKLTFDKAVKITIPNAAGKLVGYARAGEPFHKITDICVDDTQTTNDLLPDDTECKIDVGSDLVVWTKHFTEFVTYTQTPVTSSGTTTASSGDTSSGHSGSSSNCAYSCAAWGTCVNGKQTRTCTPNIYCDENDPNKATTERTCSTTEENIPLGSEISETTPIEDEQVNQPTPETEDQNDNGITGAAVTEPSGFGAHPWLAGILITAIIGGLGIFVYVKFMKK